MPRFNRTYRRNQPINPATARFTRGKSVYSGLQFWLNAGAAGPCVATMRNLVNPAVNECTGANLDYINSPAFGNAWLLNSTSDEIRSVNAYNNTIKNNNVHTWSLWCNATSFASSPIPISANTTANDFWFEFGTTTAAYWGYGGSYRTYTVATWVANQWYMITGVKTGTTSGNLYVNGILQTSYTGNYTNAVNTSRDLLIGTYPTTTYYFTGSIADVKLWNRALSDQEVASLYMPQSRWSVFGNRGISGDALVSSFTPKVSFFY